MIYILKNKNYYKVLGLDKTRNVITDESVKEGYLWQCKQLKGFSMKAKTEWEHEQIKILQKRLDEAYSTLKTEENRSKYDEILRRIDKIKKTREMEKETPDNMPISEEIEEIPDNMPISEESEDMRINISKEEYEQQSKEYERILQRINKKTNEYIRDGGKLKFTPIHKGKIGEIAPKGKRDEDER